MSHEPLLGGCLFLALVQFRVVGVHDVDGEAGLVLAGTGRGHPERGGLLGLGAFRVILAFGPLDAVFEQVFLVVVRAERGADDGMRALGLGSCEHGCKIFDDAGVHPVVDMGLHPACVGSSARLPGSKSASRGCLRFTRRRFQGRSSSAIEGASVLAGVAGSASGAGSAAAVASALDEELAAFSGVEGWVSVPGLEGEGWAWAVDPRKAR